MHPDDDDDSLSSSDSSSGDFYFSSSEEDAGGPELASTPEAGSVLPRARSAAEVFPAPGWERYQGVRLLGQGGMGRVFLAYDPRLRRNVALKFLHAGAPVRTTRFFAEARAQARVQHDRVCKVFEVGEVQGKPFIAMQYVDGKSLRALAPELTLEQKVTLLRDAAEGVHAAHRAGLIHRDLKPSNIMVERSEDGALKAYVMDFGIARDWQGEGTATGAVLGTPQYMAPEQARGEVNQLDRRADVYSLGATLYFLLTGKPPITGENGLEIISRVSSVEPASPRTLSPELPPELEAIVLKCLEKDRTQRYDSARALVEDLGRYLDGEPVLARSTGRLYRLRKRVRKHKVLVSVVAACLLLVALAGAQAVLSRREAAARERLARLFTERVEAIEARARYSGLSPLHDTREDRKALRESMAQLEAEIARGGALAVGPGRYALGRGHLALGEVEKAHQALAAAWEQGYREPRVAYALALVLGRQYQRQRLEAEQVRPAELREAQLRAVEQRFRDPALQYLRLSEGSEVPSRTYVGALLAFYEGRLDAALEELDGASTAPAWFYEASQLRGDVRLARAIQRSNAGQRNEAMSDLEAGRESYARAAAIGESVPEVYVALAELEFAAMYMELYGKGDVTPSLERGMGAVRRARAANPDDASSYMLEARFQRRLADYQVTRGLDATGAIQSALEATRAALRLAPERSAPRLEQGRLYRLWASMRQQRGLDPREQLSAAIAAFDQTPPAEHDYVFHTSVGLLFKTWAEYEDETGVDSLEHWSQAIAAYLSATALDPQRSDAWINLGRAYLSRAGHPRQQDPDGELRLAREALDKALALSPRNVVACFQRAGVSALEATRLRDRGHDPSERLRDTLEFYRRALVVNSRLPQLHNGVGLAHLDLARAEWDAGRSPEPELQRAQESFMHARALAPEQGFADLNLAELFTERAAYALASGDDPALDTQKAAQWHRQAIERLPGLAAPWATAARAQAIAAAFALEQGRDPSGHLERAQAALREAFARNAKEPGAWQQQGEVRGLQARWQAHLGRGKDDRFDEASAAYARALELEPARLEWRVAYGRFCFAWARWLRDTGRSEAASLALGLGLADKVLSARPQLAEALLLRAGLLAVQAEAAIPEQRELLRARARADVAQGLARNPALRSGWTERLPALLSASAAP